MADYQQGTTGLLDEHQPRDSSTSPPAGYTPTDAERLLIRKVEQRFQKNKKYRKRYDSKWLSNYKMFRGKQWMEARPSYRHAEVVNMIFQAIQSQVPLLTDQRPKFDFLPSEPSDREFCDILSDAADSDWENGNWLMQLTENIYDAHFYGIGYGHVCFNPELDYGAGGIVFESADPFYCYPDPEARDVNRAAKGELTRSFTYAEPVAVATLKRRFPDKAKFIKPDLLEMQKLDKTELEEDVYKSPVDARSMVDAGSDHSAGESDQALLICDYYRDDTMEPVEAQVGEEPALDEMGAPVIGPDGAPVMTPVMGKIMKKKYPNGRKTEIASGVVLSDGPLDRDDGMFPFARLLNYLLPREFHGISEVEQLEGPQKVFNKLISFALDVLTLMGNPIWVVDTNAEIDTDSLYNRPGLVVEKAPGSEVRREAGVQLQPFVLQLIDRMEHWFNGVSGTQEVSRGAAPDGVTAASAIAELQEAAQTRIRQKSRNLDCYLKDVGRLWLNTAMQNYTAPRMFRVTGKEGTEKYFKMHFSHTDEGQQTAVVQPFTQDPTGAYKETPPVEYQLRGQFDVRVNTGSTLPFAKGQKVNLAFQLFKAGAIDQLELLKAADYPNYQEVWAQVQERQMDEMAKQAAMQAPPPGAPPGAGAPPPQQAA